MVYRSVKSVEVKILDKEYLIWWNWNCTCRLPTSSMVLTNRSFHTSISEVTTRSMWIAISILRRIIDCWSMKMSLWLDLMIVNMKLSSTKWNWHWCTHLDRRLSTSTPTKLLSVKVLAKKPWVLFSCHYVMCWLEIPTIWFTSVRLKMCLHKGCIWKWVWWILEK